MSKEIIIPLSKKRVTIQLMGALAFIVLGLLLVARPFWFIRTTDATVITYIGYAAIIFFASAAIIITQKLVSTKPGFILDAEGFTDNYSGIATGKILWKNIQQFTLQEVYGQTFIMVQVHNPMHYLQMQKNPIKKQMMELNHRLYHTPIYITAHGLRSTPLHKLYRLLNEYHAAAPKR